MLHVIPENDLRKHEESNVCDCHPFMIEENGEMIMIHNSYDGRELIEVGYQKGLKMQGIKTRSGEELTECDVIETVQGTKFFCVNFFGMIPKLLDQNRTPFDLDQSMSPNIWKIGNLFENPEMRNLFRK